MIITSVVTDLQVDPCIVLSAFSDVNANVTGFIPAYFNQLSVVVNVTATDLDPCIV